MLPLPDLIAAVLALPLEARRLLAQQPGPGWDVYPDSCVGEWSEDDIASFLAGIAPVPPMPDYAERILFQGWAWLPADSAAWMNAATPEGGELEITSDRGCAIGRTLTEDDDVQYRSTVGAVTCALAAFWARFPVTP